MKLSIGIVGLPNVGKSTLFKILTKQEVHIANYPFATIDPNVGVVAVPDERLDKLEEISKSKKKIPAVVEFYDIAGLVKGANKGEGLGNQFLSHIKETQAIVVVLRVFKGEEIIHVENTVDPLRDMETILNELILKDLDTITKRTSKLESEAKSGDKKAAKNLEALKLIEEKLSQGRLVPDFSGEEINKELQLLSSKKQIYLLNGEREDVSGGLTDKIKSLGADYIVADLGSAESLPELTEEAYKILNLISFFTTGEDETRAWTIERGTLLPQASGVIHSDFEKKFIRAEVIGWRELLQAAHSAGSGQAGWTAAKQKGLVRIEGKEYVVQDGDVIVVRHG